MATASGSRTQPVPVSGSDDEENERQRRKYQLFSKEIEKEAKGTKDQLPGIRTNRSFKEGEEGLQRGEEED
ncbi:hypothetical protein E1B28_004909 [Marasmius oreades]|uniref:Uncharacterized protein n=1 Tax=Marasmius oreades TaxID=181124 RepID=A0A9P8ADG6_9AGAR|nr:uncharacterized protein E1B28_004909 [Marasmius oreades]KAG7097572.1 hypothetical protein E1B28_004909 [Marasmius oreades]